MTFAYGHNLQARRPWEGTMCIVCSGVDQSLPLECPGKPMTVTQLTRVSERKLDFIGGQWWVPKDTQGPIVPRVEDIDDDYMDHSA